MKLSKVVIGLALLFQVSPALAGIPTLQHFSMRYDPMNGFAVYDIMNREYFSLRPGSALVVKKLLEISEKLPTSGHSEYYFECEGLQYLDPIGKFSGDLHETIYDLDCNLKS